MSSLHTATAAATVERCRRKAYSYIRFSTPDQLLGDSERRQLKRAREYAARLGLDLDDQFREYGTSAYRGRHRKRGVLARLLRLVRDGEIEPGTVLIIEEINRLTREPPFEAIKLIWLLIDAGIEIHVLRGERVYSRETINEDGLLDKLSGQIQRAFEESQEKSERVREKVWLRKDAAHGYKVPFSLHCPGWLRVAVPSNAEDDLGAPLYEPIPERAEVVRRIFDLRETGHSIADIIEILNKEGVPTFSRAGQGIRDKRVAPFWDSVHVWRILRSHAVIGEGQLFRDEERSEHPKTKKPFLDPDGKPEKRVCSIPDGDPIQGYFGAGVVPREQFERVQSILDSERRATGPRGEHFRNLLRGLCRCGLCGGSLLYRYEVKKTAEYHHLYCQRRSRKAGCEQPYHDYTKVEQAALAALRDELFPPGTFAVTDNQIDSLNRVIDEAKSRIDAMKAQNERWAKRESETFDDLVQENDRKIAGERETIARLESQRDHLRVQKPARHADIVAGLLADAHQGNIRARVRVSESLRAVIDRIVFLPGGRQLIVRRDGFIAYVREGRIVAAMVALANTTPENVSAGLLDGLEKLAPRDTHVVASPEGVRTFGMFIAHGTISETEREEIRGFVAERFKMYRPLLPISATSTSPASGGRRSAAPSPARRETGW